jgi:hypothetical protein
VGSILKKLREDPLVLNVQELYVYPELVKKKNKRSRFFYISLVVFVIFLSLSLFGYLTNEDDQALPSSKSGNFSLSNSLEIGDKKYD